MSDVKAVEIVPVEPNQSLIEHLEELLDKAKSGEMRGIFVVQILGGDYLAPSYVGGTDPGDLVMHSAHIIGELSVIQTRLEMISLGRDNNLPGVDFEL